ncbi:unnamed protein product [Protopolystoma xenopodis]|uniref:Uncharacterized protein n=1 Tax=Protopolystoma xenopodis TaxID=117903 RepID=A0A3S5B1K6_9PLAT|nr:unnamed protein product [Protopolystoma xenopodis]
MDRQSSRHLVGLEPPADAGSGRTDETGRAGKRGTVATGNHFFRVASRRAGQPTADRRREQLHFVPSATRQSMQLSRCAENPTSVGVHDAR